MSKKPIPVEEQTAAFMRGYETGNEGGKSRLDNPYRLTSTGSLRSSGEDQITEWTDWENGFEIGVADRQRQTCSLNGEVKEMATVKKITKVVIVIDEDNMESPAALAVMHALQGVDGVELRRIMTTFTICK